MRGRWERRSYPLPRRRSTQQIHLITLKGNQRKAHAEVKDWFASNAFAPGASLRPCREDASCVRDRTAARNLALLRKIALNLVRADGSLTASLKGKRKYAAWDDAFMAKLIAG